MEEERSSQIGRTKYSHTVSNRVDSSVSASSSVATEPERTSSSNMSPDPSPGDSPSHQRSSSRGKFQFQRNPLTNKLRSLSPGPRTILSDTFKEAKSSWKRFSTPNPQRKGEGSLSRSESFETKSPKRSSTSPLRYFRKGYEKPKSKRDSAWTKYFDHSAEKANAVEAADEFAVDMSKLLLGNRFAQGAHSKLYHGVYKDEPVAVKIIRAPDDGETGNLAIRLRNQYDREVSLLSRLNHPNVIKFIAACKRPPVYCIITEYLSEGSLRVYLHNLEEKSLPLEKLIAFALEIARGMEYIHSQGIIHRDLKPDNVLIDKDFHLKIADFGIACEEAFCDALADDAGTYRWMAPEMIKKKPFGRRVDVYSFGLILWQMVSGMVPYKDMNPVQAAFAVVNKNLRPVIPRDYHPAMRALIEQCWSLQPDKRPEFWQIVKVLEQFESSLAQDGTLNLVQTPAYQDQKKGLLHWIQKLGPTNPTSNPTPKPKFS